MNANGSTKTGFIVNDVKALHLIFERSCVGRAVFTLFRRTMVCRKSAEPKTTLHPPPKKKDTYTLGRNENKEGLACQFLVMTGKLSMKDKGVPTTCPTHTHTHTHSHTRTHTHTHITIPAGRAAWVVAAGTLASVEWRGPGVVGRGEDGSACA